MLQTRVNSGLDGVIVADTAMSEVDGEAGRLVVRGHAVEELVATRGFEGVAALLWDEDEKSVRVALAKARSRAFADVPRLLVAAKGLTPVEGLRVGLAMLPDNDPMPAHHLVCGAMPVFLAALLSEAKGLPAIAPDPSLTTAQDLLRMIRGQRADEAIRIAQFSPQIAVSEDLFALLNSAVANAKQKNPAIRDASELWVTEALVDEGVTMKRYRPRAQGRGYQILKRSSQISVTLSDDKNYRPISKAAARKAAAEAAQSSEVKSKCGGRNLSNVSPSMFRDTGMYTKHYLTSQKRNKTGRRRC